MTNNRPDQHSSIEQTEDPLWDILGRASEAEAGPFFAKNILRSTRQLPQKVSVIHRMKDILSPKAFAMSTAAACACIFAVFQILPSNETTELADNAINQLVTPITETVEFEISEFILQETLLAAAEDLSIFTHDEILAMVGF